MLVNRIYPVLFLLLFITSCYHADGIANEQEVELKIVSTHDLNTFIVYDVYSQKKLLPNSDGNYNFTTPFVRTFSNLFFFIEYESYSTKDVKILEIKRGTKLLAEISLYDIKQLPTDNMGRYILKLNE